MKQGSDTWNVSLILWNITLTEEIMCPWNKGQIIVSFLPFKPTFFIDHFNSAVF